MAPRAGGAARRDKARLKFLIDALGDTIVVFDAKDRVAMFNVMARVLYSEIGIVLRRGMTYRELLAQAAVGGGYPEAKDDIETWTQQALERFRQPRTEIHKHGERYEQLFQMKMPGGETLRRHSDVTGFVRRNAELEQSRMQLAETAEALREAAAKSEAASAEKTRFLARISHALRTPLNAISGGAWLLGDEALAETGRRHVETILNASRHLVSLADDIADFARMERGSLELKPVATYLAECLERPVSIARGLGPDRIPVQVELCPDVPACVIVDGGRVEQILLHLLENAVRHTEAGRVVVRASVTGGGSLSFVVQDTGCGIPAEDLKRIFEPFVQGSAPSGEARSGMGLALTRRLVSLLGGTIAIESRLGEGTCVTVDLPVEIVPEAPPVPSAPEALGALDILVADDVKSARQLLKTLLERDGHRVVTVEDGAQAVAAARRQTFDVILLDLEMPHLDGFEAARAIRLQNMQPQPRIFACTAQVFDVARDRALASGMDDFMPKPVNPARLRALLAECMTHCAAGPAHRAAAAS